MLFPTRKQAIERAHAICQKVFDLSDEYRTKGKEALQDRIAEDLSLNTQIVFKNIQTFRALVAGKAQIDTYSRIYNVLNQDKKFVRLAERAMAKYDAIPLVSTELAKQRAYDICRKIIDLSDEYQNRGKIALQERIVEDSDISYVTEYIRTIRAVALGGDVSKYYRAIYKDLKQDKKFVRLARKATELYDSLDRTYTVRRVCRLIIDLSDEHKNKGKAALKFRIVEALRTEGIKAPQRLSDGYIRIIRAVAEGSGAPKEQCGFYEILAKDKAFVRLAKEAITKYDALGSAPRANVSKDALYAEVVGLAQSNAGEIIERMPRGIHAVHEALKPGLAEISSKKHVSETQLTEEVIVWTFAGYLFSHSSDPQVAGNPRAFLKGKGVPAHLHRRILDMFGDAMRQRTR